MHGEFLHSTCFPIVEMNVRIFIVPIRLQNRKIVFLLLSESKLNKEMYAIFALIDILIS